MSDRTAFFVMNQSSLSPYNLAEDPAWFGPMSIRHAVSCYGKLSQLPNAVAALEALGKSYGCVRHGSLFYESWDYSHQHGLASHFKIVDVGKYTRKTEEVARDAEYARIRNLPWWRRLFMPVERRP